MVFLIIFIIVSIIHLFACLTGKTNLRGFTKPLLMPLLLASAWQWTDGQVPLLLTLALIFGWLGDVALLFSEKQWSLPAGILFFAIEHVLYVPLLLKGTPSAKFFPIGILLLLVIFVVGFSIAKAVLPHFKGVIRKAVGFYMIIILAMVFAAFYRGLTLFTLDGLVSIIGALLFSFSDFVLSTELYQRETPVRSFVVMLTYILAQTLLTVSLLFTF